MIFTAGLATDKGTVKEINQDAMMLKVVMSKEFGRIAFGLVCDGCGGLSFGEVASAAYVRRMEEWFYNELPKLLSYKDATRRLDDARDFVSDPIELIKGNWTFISGEMNEKLYEFGLGKNASVGTTVCMLIIIGDDYLAMNIGDSRIYRASLNNISCITHDHSYVQKQIDEGLMSQEQADSSPMRSVLLQCVGAVINVEPFFVRGKVIEDDTFLLCCDGFWRKTEVEDFTKLMNAKECSSEDIINDALKKHIDRLKNIGEKDNISAVLIRAQGAI